MSRLRAAVLTVSAAALSLGGVVAINRPAYALTTAGGEKPSDCKETACLSTVDSFKQSFAKASIGVSPTKQEQATARQKNEPLDGPPNRETLGRAGWTILHTFAAYYPDSPTAKEQGMAKSFLEAFSHLYPCKDCAEGLRMVMEDDPPRVESRVAFSLWVCQTHNKVNEAIGKPMQPCNIEVLDRRWRGKKQE